MNYPNRSAYSTPMWGFLFLLFVYSYSHAETSTKLIIGTMNCSAQWNEHCEDKKIISVPEHYKLCRHDIQVVEKTGDVGYQVVAADQSGITVYFKAKGNLDRAKPQGASLKLQVDLFGVKETETCEEILPEIAAPPEVSTPAPLLTPAAVPVPVQAPGVTEKINTPHACACSQWLNWMKVEHCLARGTGREGIPCDGYPGSIQCVTSKDECRSIQKENCPQVVGLNQSTSFKRLFIENSPYCQP